MSDARPDGESPVHAVLRRVSMVDFPGRIAAVLFVSGCNFRCGFCHNSALAARLPSMAWADLAARCRRFRLEWADGAVISGGEPTLSSDLTKLVDLLASLGFAVKLDTNGSCPDSLRAVLPKLDYVAMDLKTCLSDYESLTGFVDTDAIARSVGMIKADARDYEFRTTVIPGRHTEDTMRAMLPLLSGAKRYTLQPFLPRDDLPDPALRGLQRTPHGLMESLAAVARPVVRTVAVRG
jgi:pyruvate formate lyase activating enzyme